MAFPANWLHVPESSFVVVLVCVTMTAESSDTTDLKTTCSKAPCDCETERNEVISVVVVAENQSLKN